MNNLTAFNFSTLRHILTVYFISGSYSLVESDGTKRVVEYEADHKNGFNAVVHKIGTPKEQPSSHGQEYAHEYQSNEYAQASQGSEGGHYGYQ